MAATRRCVHDCCPPRSKYVFQFKVPGSITDHITEGFEKVVCISAAKVPIVKVWDPTLGLACDMNVNNTLALENTRMIRTYVEIDPRVRQLAMLIKYWTRRRKVNDAGMLFCDILQLRS